MGKVNCESTLCGLNMHEHLTREFLGMRRSDNHYIPTMSNAEHLKIPQNYPETRTPVDSSITSYQPLSKHVHMDYSIDNVCITL